MKKENAKYKKEPVKLRLRDRKDDTQVVYLEFCLHGKRTYERIPELLVVPETDADATRKNKATLKEAEKILKQKLREVKKSERLEREAVNEAAVRDIERPMMLKDWIEQYIEMQKRRGLREKSKGRLLMRMLDGYGIEIPLARMDKSFLLGFIDYLKGGYIGQNGMPMAPKTAFNVLGELNTALNTAVREGIIVANPMLLLETYEKIHYKEAIMEYLTIDEVKLLADTPCDCPIVKQAFLFACNCGLRRSDILSLKWNDITLSDGKCRVGTRMVKTERIVYIPLPKQALKWLPENIEQRPHKSELVFEGLSEKKITGHLKPWIEAAGIKGKTVTFHTSRHTYATMLLTLGADIYTVSKLLGHTSIRHTQRYARVVDAKKDEAVHQLDMLMPKNDNKDNSDDSNDDNNNTTSPTR